MYMNKKYEIFHCFLSKYCQERPMVFENEQVSDGYTDETLLTLVIPNLAIKSKAISQIHRK